MFSDELQRFLEWLDTQIEPTLKGEDTPLRYIVDKHLPHILEDNPLCEADAICYHIVESFSSNEDSLCFKVLNIKYDRQLTDEEISDLLLKIPIRYVMLLIK